MSEIDWRHVETQVFDDEDQDDFALVTATAKVESALAAKLLLDPRPHLIELGVGVDESWAVSLTRVNADRPIPLPPSGPRKIVAVWMLIRPLRLAHGVVYRVPPSEAEQSS